MWTGCWKRCAATGEHRPRLVHRLDRDTTGVLLIARTPGAAAKLAAAFRGRDMDKTYWAVVAGRPVPVEGEIDLPLKRIGGDHGERTAPAERDDEEAARAITEYRTLDHAARKLAWLELKPHHRPHPSASRPLRRHSRADTGRHEIRPPRPEQRLRRHHLRACRRSCTCTPAPWSCRTRPAACCGWRPICRRTWRRPSARSGSPHRPPVRLAGRGADAWTRSPKRDPRRAVALWIGLLAVLCILGAGTGFVLWSLDPGRIKPRLIEAAERATGRTVTIAGKLKLSLSLVPTLSMDNVALSNPAGYSRPDMVKVAHVEVSFALLPLLRHQFEINRIALDRPDILLETDAAGRPNWIFTRELRTSADMSDDHAASGAIGQQPGGQPRGQQEGQPAGHQESQHGGQPLTVLIRNVNLVDGHVGWLDAPDPDGGTRAKSRS